MGGGGSEAWSGLGGGRPSYYGLGAAAGALLLLAYAGSFVAAGGPSERAEYLYTIEAVKSLLLAALVLFAAWRTSAAGRRGATGWWLLSAAYASYAAADFVSMVLNVELAGHALSPLLNALYLAFYPLFVAGVFFLPRSPLTPRERVRTLLDMGVVLLAAVTVHWTLFQPLLDDMQSEDTVKPVLSLAYPAGDIALLWAAMSLLFGRRDPATRRVAFPLAASVGVLIAADVAYSFSVLDESNAVVPYMSAGYMLSHLLAAFAALEQLVSLRAPEPGRGRPALDEKPLAGSVYAAYACLGASWLAVVGTHWEELSAAASLGLLGMVGLALAREVLSQWENSRLTRGLRQARDELELRVLERTAELVQAYDSTLQGWSMALELRDQETQGHTLRVADLTVRLARAVGVPEAELGPIRQGALLHDIGKMGIPDGILLKPGPLDGDEWALMRRHTDYARDLLGRIDFLQPAMDIPCSHHERWEGAGYPQGLRGEEIPLAARIFAVVDCYDALTHDRPYRAAWEPQKALDYVREHSGTHFDPRVVEAFLEIAIRE